MHIIMNQDTLINTQDMSRTYHQIYLKSFRNLLSQLVLLFILVESKLIELKIDNFVSLRDDISIESSSQLLYRLNLLNTSPLYIYINSPGGDVIAGLEIINYIKSLQERNIEINCICHNAMSMAFTIFQYCSNRYILHASTLMQHQMSIQVKGKLYDINSRMKYYNIIENDINLYQAARLKMSIVDFTKKIQNDYWLYSSEIIHAHAADEIVSIFCTFVDSTEMINTTTLFGEINTVYSSCPIINYPIKIIFPSLFSEANKKEFINSKIQMKPIMT